MVRTARSQRILSTRPSPAANHSGAELHRAYAGTIEHTTRQSRHRAPSFDQSSLPAETDLERAARLHAVDHARLVRAPGAARMPDLFRKGKRSGLSITAGRRLDQRSAETESFESEAIEIV
jgi:hypothetical protein